MKRTTQGRAESYKSESAKHSFRLVIVVLMIWAGTNSMKVMAQQGTSGDLSVVGHVGVDGPKVQTRDLIFPGSTVHTAKGSSAVVSLGKLGRVEVFPSTRMELDFDFDDESITVEMLDAGRVRISSSSGTTAQVKTRDGVIVADGTAEAVFVVSTECGNTVVSVETGIVLLRAGDSVKQIAAGNQDTAGTVKPGLCKHNTRS